MWLVRRDSDGTGAGRIELPDVLRAALVRWYVGRGTRDDEEAGIALVQQARIGARWIACDCLAGDVPPPILTPAFLSEAETYYLRRLTSAKRPEHQADCPFFRDQVTHRLSEVRHPDAPADPPDGWFEVLKPAPEKLAQRPDETASDDRTRQASIPRLARLLWRLLDNAGLNRCSPLADERETAIGDQFRRLATAAARVEVAPGIELGRVLWTHAAALHGRRTFATLRALADRWPAGHAPQGFITLFATSFRGSEIVVSGGDPVRIANRIQSPSTRANPIDGPFLVIVVVGEYPEAHGYAPLRAYAQPIYSGHRFIPVDTAFERQAIKALLAARRSLDRAGIDLVLEKPIFDRLTPLGSCRPDFLVEARSRLTGEIKLVAIEALGKPTGERLAMRRAALAPLRDVVPVIEIAEEHITRGQVGDLLAAGLDL
ncbi:hypothetical protein D9601_17325 [Sphingomonas sp. MA1305]|jgi:hypothetical protein|uniref:hypothetical protein n=1 Tax=Sphingomonas sp. MA1305 TaxID=2479204 RepID=UPI0018DF8BCC|nr:hypothetical protein [Sphingomonas sp. MA1305]